jgi:hypothetical protein
MPGLLISALVDNADAVAAGSVGSVAISRPTVFNGSTWDRLRSTGSSAGAGLGVMAASPAIPGASIPKIFNDVLNPTSTRATLITPTSGKKIRIISFNAMSKAGDFRKVRFYFGSGAAFDTSTTTGIGIVAGYSSLQGFAGMAFPDGAGPVGAVDAVVSWISDGSLAPEYDLVITYREE